MRRASPVLVLLVLVLLTGAAIGLGASEAPAGSVPQAARGHRLAVHAIVFPGWLKTDVVRQLDTFPILARGPSSSLDHRAGEEASWAVTTAHQAWQAMGQPGIVPNGLVGPGRIGAEKAWLVVVTGTTEYEDIAGYVSSENPLPTGNTVEFVFDPRGYPLVTSAASEQTSARGTRSFPGLRFHTVSSPLPVRTTPVGVPTSLTRRGHVGFGSCPSPTTEMTISASSSVITQHEWFGVNLTATNRSQKPCHFIGSPDNGVLRRQEMGPCGAMTMNVLNSAGELAWPLGQYLCPLLQRDTLKAGETVKIRGLWYGGKVRPGSTPWSSARPSPFS